jgi:hypothetical protein
MRIYVDAALHPRSRILDGSPMRHRSCSHRRLTAASAVINSGPNHAVINSGPNHAVINPGRNQQIAVVRVTHSAVERDTWTRR